MDIIGYHTSGNIIINSLGRGCAEPPYLDWLLQQPSSIKLFYNLDYAVANIVWLIGLTKEEGAKLLDTGRLYLPPYELKYIPAKFFSVKKGFHHDAPFVMFSNAQQYGLNKLEDTTGDPKLAMNYTARAQAVGYDVYNTMELLGVKPNSLTSPISMFQKAILNNMDLPTVDDIPDEAGEFAYNCCHGTWVEAYQRGHWDKCYDYDITSAYPYQVSRLLDIRKGHWHNYPLYMPDATYGYCKGKVTIEAPFSPIIYDSEPNYTPTGTWNTYITKAEWNFINRHNLGHFEPEDCWWWVADDQIYPLQHIVLSLFLHKQSSTGLAKEVVKRIMSGVWGKFLELRQGEMGSMFNPVWGAEVESNTRLEVAEFCLQSQQLPIHIAVDGVTVPEPVNVALTDNDIGRWHLTSNKACLCIGSGVIALQGKWNGLDFSLDYDSLIDYIRDNPKSTSQVINKTAPVTLAKAIQQNKWNDLGKLETLTKTIDFTYENKRAYRTEPRVCGDLMKHIYISEPWDVSLINEPIKRLNLQ